MACGKSKNWSKMFDVWILLSGFGIMFAILSWCQECGILPKDLTWQKGALAVALGTMLYLLFIPFLR